MQETWLKLNVDLGEFTIPSGFCLQERFEVKNPPSVYIQKLKSVLEQGGGRKVLVCVCVWICECDVELIQL